MPLPSARPAALDLRPVPLGECVACGAWSQARACPECQWQTMSTPTSVGVAPPPVRVLVELVVEHTGRLRLAQLHCHRLPWLADEDTVLQALSALLEGRAFHADPHAWLALLESLEAPLLQRLALVFEGSGPPEGWLRSCLRLRVHAPGLSLQGIAGPRVEVVDFTDQMSRLGASVSLEQVTVGLSGVRLDLDPERRSGLVSVSSQVDLLVVGMRLMAETRQGRCNVEWVL